MMMGKGSGRRPLLIPEQDLVDRWDAIFKQKPHEGQFDGNVTNTSSTSKDEEGKLPTSADSGNI
jgi:hypothetical protein